jgi:hypothetical protein
MVIRIELSCPCMHWNIIFVVAECCEVLVQQTVMIPVLFFYDIPKMKRILCLFIAMIMNVLF